MVKIGSARARFRSGQRPTVLPDIRSVLEEQGSEFPLRDDVMATVVVDSRLTVYRRDS